MLTVLYDVLISRISPPESYRFDSAVRQPCPDVSKYVTACTSHMLAIKSSSAVLAFMTPNLGRIKKTVFIATHNANIAVRTLPYTSIYRKYDKGEYKTYVGNPFTNKLLNINNENDVLSWREESMRTLEGGEAAFKNRGEIYESGK